MCLPAQAEKLDGLLAHRGIGIDRVLNFSVPDSVLVRFVLLERCCMYILAGQSPGVIETPCMRVHAQALACSCRP